MVDFIGGPAGGFPNSRALGTKVTLAGRTAFLPNDDIPFEGVKVPVPIEDAIMYFTGFSCYLHELSPCYVLQF